MVRVLKSGTVLYKTHAHISLLNVTYVSSSCVSLRVVLVGFEVILQVRSLVHSRLRYEFRVNLFTFARGFPG